MGVCNKKCLLKCMYKKKILTKIVPSNDIGGLPESNVAGDCFESYVDSGLYDSHV